MQTLRIIFDRQIARFLVPLVNMGFVGMLVAVIAGCVAHGKSVSNS